MPGYALLIDLHKRSLRQGPGGETETALALSLANLPGSRRLKILDIGCGTGAATRQLARVLNADVTALDLVWDFIDILAKNIRAEELSDSVIPIVGTMDSMPFSAGEFDLIWSEGAVYNMGFERGVRAWKHFLAPGGILVVSDLTWTTAARPAALQQFWDKEYPEVATAGDKIAVLERAGYALSDHFLLSEHCWIDNYYRPLQQGFPDFMRRHQGSLEAAELVAEHEREIALYHQYKNYYSYGVYIASRQDENDSR